VVQCIFITPYAYPINSFYGMRIQQLFSVGQSNVENKQRVVVRVH